MFWFRCSVCDRLGDAERAASLYRALVPHADQWVRGSGVAALCLGPLSRTLGQLAATTASWAEAALREEAQQPEAPAGAPPASR